jgi:predicted PhzF superfamily epimerase YddE/YHI9
VELSSGKEVADIIPNINEIKKCDGRGVIVTGPAPAGSDYDFFSRFFCPKFGIDEVCRFFPPNNQVFYADNVAC